MYYSNNELPPQRGWICPKCGRVNAPWKSSCDCVSTQTTGTGTAYLVKTSSISRDSHEIAEQTEPQCETCLHYGAVFTDDDSFDTCMMDECHYEPKDEPQTDCPTSCPSKDICTKDIADCSWK